MLSTAFSAHRERVLLEPIHRFVARVRGQRRQRGDLAAEDLLTTRAGPVPITLRERTVMPQHGPSTRSITKPGGASKVVSIGIL